VVARRQAASVREPLLEAFELRQTERGREIRQSVVVAELDHRVRPVAASRQLGLDAVVPKTAQRHGEVIPIGQDRAAFPGRHDLGRMQAEHGQVGQRSDGASLERRAERMGRVRDDRQPPARRRVRDRPERGIIGRLAAVVDRDDGLRQSGDRRSHGGGIDQQRAGHDVREARCRADVQDGVGAGHERHRRRDRLVAGPQPGHRGGAMQRGGPGAERDGMPGSGRVRQGGLELGDARAGRQPIGSERGRDRRDVALIDDLVGVRQ